MGLLGSDEDEPGGGLTAGFDPAESLSGLGKNNMKRVIDEQAGVVIYAIDDKSGYAMTAVPLEHTWLGAENTRKQRSGSYRTE
jgi:hypothetical protein